MHFTVTEDLAAVGGMGESNPVPWGEGDLYVHAFVSNPEQTAAFALSLRYAGRNESGAPVRVNLPISAAPAADPLDLDPWPASELIRAGALPLWGFLRGKLVTAWDAKPSRSSFASSTPSNCFRRAMTACGSRAWSWLLILMSKSR